MYRNGRPVDDEFDASHKLYLRIDGDNFYDGNILAAGIRIADQSVNWSKYSLPWDVLFGYPDCGVGRFHVRDIPTPVPQDENAIIDPNFIRYKYFPKHVPENDNYGHCEIKATRSGRVITDAAKIKADIVKKEFKSRLMQSINVLLEPREAG